MTLERSIFYVCEFGLVRSKKRALAFMDWLHKEKQYNVRQSSSHWICTHETNPEINIYNGGYDAKPNEEGFIDETQIKLCAIAIAADVGFDGETIKKEILRYSPSGAVLSLNDIFYSDFSEESMRISPVGDLSLYFLKRKTDNQAYELIYNLLNATTLNS